MSVPRDLYAASDIRFVMVEIGKLTSSVQHLLDDVKSQGTKLDGLRMTVAWVAGVFATLLAIAAFVPPSARERLFHAIMGG